MTSEEYKTLVYSSTGLERDASDAIDIGIITPRLVPETGVFFIMEEYCSRINALLQLLPPNSIEYARLMSVRCFTYQELQALYDRRIRPKDFLLHPVFTCLGIQTEQERAAWTSLYPTPTPDAFFVILCKVCKERGIAALEDFFFEGRQSYGTSFRKTSFAAAWLNRWCIRGRKKQNDRADVFFYARKIKKILFDYD
jgi:hypothetical protein